MRLPLLIFPCLCWILPIAAAEPLEFEDGERVILLGGTLIEREQASGYWETRLTREFPDRRVIFRNLGWSGDTVWGESRAGFGDAAEGFRNLKEQVAALRPTRIFVAYGANESFRGATGLAAFREGLATLLDALAETGAELVLVSPTPREHAGPLLPDPTEPNRNLALYRDAIRETANERSLRFVDLYQRIDQRGSGGANGSEPPLTDNGLHFTEHGYRETADLLAQELGWPSRAWPSPGSPEAERVEQLRQAIIAKNRLFFHRWRPQNITYLFGFRKHEQGQNAREVAEFDPLVEQAEQRIREALAAGD